MRSPVASVIPMAFALSLIGVNSCSTAKPEAPKTSTVLSADSKANTTKTTGEPAPEEKEGADVPTNIAGSYLTCALRRDATATDLSQQYGCLLSDSATGKKIDQDSHITWQSSAASGFDFSDPDSDYTGALYNTLLVVRGASKAEIDAKVQSTDIIALYGLQSIVIKRLYNVLKPAFEVQDFEAPIVRDQAIEIDRSAPPVDPF